MSKEKRPSVTVNAVLYWPYLTQKSETSDAYQVDLCKLSSKAVKALTDMGITVKEQKPDKEDDDRGYYITCKSKYPITAKDYETREDISHMPIGNGTVALASVSPYEWTFKGKSGVSASIGELLITELVEYEGSIPGVDEEAAL